MKKHLHISILLILVLLTGCSPKIKSSIISKQSTLPYDAEIFVFSVKDPIPEGLKSVGNISLGDTGFTIKCSYEIMIGKAKTEARKAGANIIKHVIV